MVIEKRKISELNPSKYNPRIELKETDETYKKLEKSMEEFGYVEPVIVNKRNNVIIGGHQRIKILKNKGLKEIECVIVDLDKKKEKKLNLALNKITGNWDDEKLKELFEDLELNAEELIATGFSNEEVEKLFEQFDETKDEEGFNEKESLEKINNNPTTKLGDIYILGNHRLMCGDSTNNKSIEKLLNGNKIKCLFTSPPYNMGAGLYENYEDDLESKKYIDFNLNIINAWSKYIKGYLFWNISYNKNTRWEFIEIMYRIIKETKLKFMELIVWDKGHALPITSKEMLTRQYEDILMIGDEDSISEDMELYYLGTSEKRGYFNKRKGKGISNYWKISTGNTQLDNHKACFPLELPKKAIELTTNRNDIVADCFGGSGTTLIAAEQLGRKCYMMELDPVYCDVIIDRWEKYTGEKAIKEN